MVLYKLTDQNGQTRGGCQWGEGVEHTAPGTGNLCTAGWLHAYTHPLLAVFVSPVHPNLADPVLWEAEGDVGKDDCGLKVGCTRLKTIRRIPLPEVTVNQRIRFAIYCAKAVRTNARWDEWADGWLNRSDRTADAARAAYDTADASAAAAASAVADATDAADAADAAYATAHAAAHAANVGQSLDLIALAERAVRDEPLQIEEAD